MAENVISVLQHKYYKIWVTLLVLGMAAFGITVGVKSYGPNYIRYNVEIVNLTLSFINTALLLVIVSIVLKLGEPKK